MRQSELAEYEFTGEQCPSCERVFDTRQGVSQHHSTAHGETIKEYEDETTERIECPKGCGEYKNLAIHWGKMHDGGVPANVPKLTDESKKRYSEIPGGGFINEKQREEHSERMSGEGNPNYGGGFSEEHRQNLSEALSGENHPMYGETFSEERRKRHSEALSGRTITEEHREKISESHTGKTLSEEHREKLSEAFSGENNPMYGEEHSKESRRKMSENHAGGGRVPLCVVPTQHEVLNFWEAEIDLLLHDSGFEFQYEPRQFDIGGRHYTPDFKVGSDIIEVKGRNWRDAGERAERFMKHHPKFRYIVIGTRLPCDVHIEWKDRSSLVQTLDNAV